VHCAKAPNLYIKEVCVHPGVTLDARPRQDSMTPSVETTYQPAHSFAWLFFGKVVLLVATIVVVWALYAYLHAYRLDWLGWSYSKLLPLTNALYRVVETYFPPDVKYKIRGAITDDLGQRSLFLLLLTAFVELALYSLFALARHVIRPRT
jgi:hypothetical protein